MIQRLQVLLGTLSFLSALVVLWCWFKQWQDESKNYPASGWLLVAVISYLCWWVLGGGV